MRSFIAAGCAYLAFATAAAATGPSWPITPFVTYPTAQTIGADGAKATVQIRVDDDASAVDVEVYGVDGMRAGDDNLLRAHRDQLAKGASFTFDVTIHPGPGRSSLVVSAKARFAHAGAGGTLREFRFGEESEEQLREHTRCVRQDPEGVWIRELGCDDAMLPKIFAQTPILTPLSHDVSPTNSLTVPPITVTVAEFRASPPIGSTVRIVGYVVEAYRCPPCPKGAQCKPCFIGSTIFIADAPNHAPFGLDAPPTDVLAIATQDTAEFESNIPYRFEIAVTDRQRDHFDGRLLRHQRPDREPIWTDSP